MHDFLETTSGVEHTRLPQPKDGLENRPHQFERPASPSLAEQGPCRGVELLRPLQAPLANTQAYGNLLVTRVADAIETEVE